MAVYKRAPTWGEAVYSASWGLANMTWGGYFLTYIELTPLGIIKMSISPQNDIEFDNSPSITAKFDNTPQEDIEFDNTPSITAKFDNTPSVDAYEV